MAEELKQYYLDTYKKELKAKITKIDGNKIYLDKTIFYPEGGGQPGDKGYINNFTVLDTQKDGNDIYHLVDEETNLKVGDEILLKLDWNHRYYYMKMHAAQHLISGILFNYFKVGTLSVHQGSSYLTIEIDNPSFSEDDCYKVEDIANEKILEGSDISYLEMNKDEALKLPLRRSIKVDGLIRIVKIEGNDLIACGGLHVKNTREIGRIMFYGVEKIRKHYRLLFKVSRDAVLYSRKSHILLKELCTLHSATFDNLLSCDKALFEKNLNLERQMRALKKENANLILTALLNSKDENIIIEDISDRDFEFKDIDLDVDKVLFLYKKENNLLKWFLYLGESFKSYNFKDIREKVLILINGKGGGRFPYFQGKGELTDIERFKEAFLGYFNE